MDFLIHGIIDYVAKPSSADTPVRVLRKSLSESPSCTSAVFDGGLEDEVKESSSPPRLPSLGGFDSESVSRGTPNDSVLTADGILFDSNTGHFPSYASCGNCSVIDGVPVSPVGCNREEHVDEDDTPADTVVRRQFEAAFATFLYKNPAFMSMSHTSLQKSRQKLLRQSARNVSVEAELRQELSELREFSHHTKLEIQKELLLITKAKAARESELQNQIAKNRAACLQLDSMWQAVAWSPRSSNRDVKGECYPGGLSAPSTPVHGKTVLTSPNGLYDVAPSESLEQVEHQKMEEVHILAERVKIQMQIAKAKVSIELICPKGVAL